MDSQKNGGLIAAIVFASLVISGSMVYASMQLRPVPPTTSSAPVAGTVSPQQAPAVKPSPVSQSQVQGVVAEDHILGNKNAPISLIEYSDFECPFCKKFHPTAEQVVSLYGDKVNLIYRQFPLSIHANAEKEAEASECANALGGNDKFWEYTDKIFERTRSNGTGFALDALVPLAKEIGLDEKKFKDCLDQDTFATHIQQDIASGTAAGVTGTPGNILLNNATKEQKALPGAQPLAVFKQAIDGMLSK